MKIKVNQIGLIDFEPAFSARFYIITVLLRLVLVIIDRFITNSLPQ